MVKVYASLYVTAHAQENKNRPEHREKLYAVESAFNEALKKHTLQSKIDKAPDWEKWYNDNKGKKEW
jgi:hypothetical protein